MELNQILSILGVGTLSSLIITSIYNAIINGSKARAKRKLEFIEALKENDEAQKLGLQALLRDRLLTLYQEANKKGFASLEDKQNFENLYIRYHNLGANGIMDSIREKFLELPLEKPKKRNLNG